MVVRNPAPYNHFACPFYASLTTCSKVFAGCRQAAPETPELNCVQQAPSELNLGEFASKRRRPTKGRHFGKLLRHYSDMPQLAYSTLSGDLSF